MLKKLQIILSFIITIVLSYVIVIYNDELEVFSFIFLLIVLGLYVGSYIVILLLYVIMYLLLSFTFKKDVSYESIPKIRKVIFNLGIEYINYLVGVKVKCSNLEKLPKDKKFFLVSNHRSIFDATTLSYAFRNKNFVCVSKPENFNLPIAGRWIKGMCHLSIDRENNRNALKTIIKAINFIEEDKFSVGIFPEGTRCKTEGLLPFKSGCFKISLKAKSPLVICTIKNSDKVLNKSLFKRTIIEMDIVDVIEYEDLKDLSTHEIALLARRKMIEHLNIQETYEESKSMIE